ncbi:hypothetical protein IFM89_001123 [Coptis chinensis]|uniref:Uncharacterized protein n=1 Tax=Coptis chinensis TaxID=261450 RepID=A0A835M438_9MAGN|nr:hypothetical protein IFM89_001123 [Coptis chinensis]
MPKKSFDMEIGGIRQVVLAEEFDDIHNQIDIVASLLERCGTQSRHTHWDHEGSWEITLDIHALAAEFGIERGLTDREKIG